MFTVSSDIAGGVTPYSGLAGVGRSRPWRNLLANDMRLPRAPGELHGLACASVKSPIATSRWAPARRWNLGRIAGGALGPVYFGETWVHNAGSVLEQEETKVTKRIVRVVCARRLGIASGAEPHLIIRGLLPSQVALRCATSVRHRSASVLGPVQAQGRPGDRSRERSPGAHRSGLARPSGPFHNQLWSLVRSKRAPPGQTQRNCNPTVIS